MDATRSLSYSQLTPIDPNETVTGFMFWGTFLDRGEILLGFYGKAKRPDERKSRWGINTNFDCYLGSSDFAFMNLPTKGKSTIWFLSEHWLKMNFDRPLHAL